LEFINLIIPPDRGSVNRGMTELTKNPLTI
jgi:hypothetical protein